MFLYILESISKGLNALDVLVGSGCCATLDYIVTYIFKQLQLKEKHMLLVTTFPNKKVRQSVLPENNVFLKVMELHPEILQNLLSTLLNIVMYDDCKNQWSMSRPLLVLLLLYEDYFRQLRENIIHSQSLEKQQSMACLFDALMDGIERNLHIRNRDRFTQNLSAFRRDLNDSLKSANNLANSSSVNEMVVS